MVKGITRTVVVIRSPDPQIFDEAIFIVKDDSMKNTGVTNREILRQAQDTAENYIREQRGHRPRPKFPGPVYALFGAGATGLIWVLTNLIL